MNERIDIMQHNLKIIREYLGWTTVEFAKKLGHSRQQIYNLETGKCKMNQCQYMAIMYLLETEVIKGGINKQQWEFLQDYLLSIKMIKKND